VRLPANGKQFHVWTIGCQMNEADSAKISATLQEAGYTPTIDEQAADIVILNSCVVRQAAEDKVAGKLNSLIRLKRERPDVSVVLTGCMVTNQQEKLRKSFPHVDLFFNPSDFAALEAVAPEIAELSAPRARPDLRPPRWGRHAGPGCRGPANTSSRTARPSQWQ
jgi:tRNA-2-methylthio-N6-dimethylallyladenosine synthase